MTNNLQRDFLKCAAVVLGCRLQLFGGQVIGEGFAKHDAKTEAEIHFAILGVHDYMKEMELIIVEFKSRRKARDLDRSSRTIDEKS